MSAIPVITAVSVIPALSAILSMPLSTTSAMVRRHTTQVASDTASWFCLTQGLEIKSQNEASTATIISFTGDSGSGACLIYR